jgi:hypothetical protein
LLCVFFMAGGDESLRRNHWLRLTGHDHERKFEFDGAFDA